MVLLLLVALAGALLGAGPTSARPAAPVTPAAAAGAPGVWDPPTGPPSARPVPRQRCRGIDPTLVHGLCLRFTARSGHPAYTWIGTLRARGGRVFFCIDYLYDSRLPGSAPVTGTARLRNQLGLRIGAREVAALNYVIDRWAPRGSTGSDARDAAIALIVREVMGDGTRPDGTVVYPGGLRVGDPVEPPAGGLDARVLGLARAMWRAGSDYRGPWTVHLTGRRGRVELGHHHTWRVSVVSAAGQRVPGQRVTLSCTGPVTCPAALRSGARPRRLTLTPRDLGPVAIRARVSGPGANGRLYVPRGWHFHSGVTARGAGTQRGWITTRSSARARAGIRVRVTRTAPEVVTTASSQLVYAGGRVRDAIRVDGTRGATIEVAWSLLGPVPPVGGACTAVDWDAAPVTATGHLTVTGDASVDTPWVATPSAGCLTWTETLAGTTTTLPVATDPGVPVETTLVTRRRPLLRTVASTQLGVVGSRVHDTVEVRGTGGATLTVRWWLLGPLPPRHGSCARLAWTAAPAAGRGRVTATGDGRVRTRDVRLRRAGCFTFRESAAPTTTTMGAEATPGLAEETLPVIRPGVPVSPHVPTGPGPRDDDTVPTMMPRPQLPETTEEVARWYAGSRPAPRWRGLDRLVVPSLGIDAPVDGVRLDRGTMAVPRDIHRVGWLRAGADPGDEMGSVVLAGHVADRHHRAGALHPLGRIRLGARVVFGGRTWLVTSRHHYDRRRGLPPRMFATSGALRLRLVTCAHPLATPRDGRHYRDNLVVTAVPVR